MKPRILEDTRRDFADEILVTYHEALMTRRIFDRLPEYSHTVPTGTRIGKRWKRNQTRYGDGWMMGEYVRAVGQPRTHYTIHWRHIVVAD